MATKSKREKASGQNDTMLQEFFVDEIKDLYWAEKHLIKALTKLEKESTTEELKGAFGDHKVQTEEHIMRLEKVFELLGEKAVAKKCDAMAGLLEEGNGVIEDTEKGTATRDVGLIISAQKVEHYEIAAYGSLSQLAATLGHSEVESILRETLEEEKQADELLTQIAENNINYEAATEEEAEA